MIPLTSKRICIKECKCLVDIVKNRITSWKNRCLSYVGRLLLIASVLESINVYWASVFLLPKTIVKDINKLLKGFLWNNGDDSKGSAKVAWSQVCKPKSEGGLGLKNIEVWNKAMVVKQLWHVASKKDSLWVKWVNIVKLKSISISAMNEDASDSWSWKNILKVKDYCVMNIGDGCNASAWFDNWSQVGALHTIITNRHLYNARMGYNMVVKDVICN